jgi:dihydroxyacid dehydratase/phosphogluconate dehydratase
MFLVLNQSKHILDIHKAAFYTSLKSNHVVSEESYRHHAQNLRSQTITQGLQRSPNRAMLRATGFEDADFTKPIVGVASAHSTITPCNMGIAPLAIEAEAGIRQAGGMPQLFGTITISDGISMGTEGMKYSSCRAM